MALLFFNFVPWFCSFPHLEVLVFLHFSIISFACVSSLFNRLLHLEAPSRHNASLLCIHLPDLLYWTQQFSHQWAVLIPLLETPGWGQLTECFALLRIEFDLFVEYAVWLMTDRSWSPNKKEYLNKISIYEGVWEKIQMPLNNCLVTILKLHDKNIKECSVHCQGLFSNEFPRMPWKMSLLKSMRILEFCCLSALLRYDWQKL